MVAAVPLVGLAAEDGGNVAYRVIRADENPSEGLVAKNPDATYTPEGHVLNGSRPGFASQYISSTSELSVAQKWAAMTGNRIVGINLDMVDSPIIDLSTAEGRDVPARCHCAELRRCFKRDTYRRSRAAGSVV